MKGIYVYGIISNETSLQTLNSRGVDFGSAAELYPFKDLLVAISRIDAQAMDEKEIQRKLQTDLDWTRRNVQAHHAVITELAGKGDAIPLRFATIFASQERFEQMMTQQYLEFKDLLFFLSGKQELGVKIYFQFEKAKQVLMGSPAMAQQAAGATEQQPRGLQWYAEKKQEMEFKEKVGKVVEEKLVQVITALDQHAVRSVFNKPLAIESSKEKGEIVLSGAYLIKGKGVDKFNQAVNEIAGPLQEEGFYVEVTGPWPPYNFVNFESGKA